MEKIAHNSWGKILLFKVLPDRWSVNHKAFAIEAKTELMIPGPVPDCDGGKGGKYSTDITATPWLLPAPAPAPGGLSAQLTGTS